MPLNKFFNKEIEKLPIAVRKPEATEITQGRKWWETDKLLRRQLQDYVRRGLDKAVK